MKILPHEIEESYHRHRKDLLYQYYDSILSDEGEGPSYDKLRAGLESLAHARDFLVGTQSIVVPVIPPPELVLPVGSV